MFNDRSDYKEDGYAVDDVGPDIYLDWLNILKTREGYFKVQLSSYLL